MVEWNFDREERDQPRRRRTWRRTHTHSVRPRPRFYNGDRYEDDSSAQVERPYGIGYDDRNISFNHAPQYEREEEEDWNVSGPYQGIGPSNYQRSDERILEDINARLTQNPHLDARSISVGVTHGIVELKGTVNSRDDKHLAEEIADSISGVIDIFNQLRVEEQNQGRTQGRPDMEGAEYSRWSGPRAGLVGLVQEGMRVWGRDNRPVGYVSEVRNSDFLLHRFPGRDVYVPFRAAFIRDDAVILDVNTHELDYQGWQTPDLIESPIRRGPRSR